MSSRTLKSQRAKSRRYIPPLKRDLMKTFNYSDIKHLTSRQRHIRLNKAIKKLNYLEIIRHLSAIATLTKNTNPVFSRRVKADQRWVSKKYNMYKMKSKKLF